MVACIRGFVLGLHSDPFVPIQSVQIGKVLFFGGIDGIEGRGRCRREESSPNQYT